MDNITHSLIGLTLAKGLIEIPFVKRRLESFEFPKRFRNSIFLTAVIASSVPDADILMSLFRHEKPLSYLLDHRGWSHTLITLPISGFISALIAMLTLRVVMISASLDQGTSRMGQKLMGADTVLLWFVGMLGVLFHIGADSWNEYGVHPFAPFESGWIYGDFIFILEPFFWIGGSVLLLSSSQSFCRIKAKWLGWGLLALLSVLMFGTALGRKSFSLSFGMGLCTLAALFFYWSLKQRLEKRWLCSALWMLVTVGAFHVSSVMARGTAAELFVSRFAQEKVIQMALSPLPMNPFCFKMTSASFNQVHATYHARTGVVSVSPELFTALECTARLLRMQAHSPAVGFSESRSGWGDISHLSNETVALFQEFRAPLSEIKELYRTLCGFRVFLQFARVPVWESPGKMIGARDQVVVSDLRYDTAQRLGHFATHLVSDQTGRGETRDGSCPVWNWTPPVQALLSND